MARSIKKGPYVFERLLAKVQKLNEEGNTIVLITHDNSIAEQAKRVVRIQDGKIIEDRPSESQSKEGRA